VATAERTGTTNASHLAATLGLGIDVALGRAVADQFDGIVDADPAVRASYAAHLAFVAMRAGDRAKAATLVHQHATSGFVRIGYNSEHLVTIIMFGRVAVWLADTEAVARLLELLLPHGGLWVVDGSAAQCWGPVDLELARLELALGRTEDATRHLETARRGLRAAGALLSEWEADAPVVSLPSAFPAGEALAENQWRRDGDIWTIHYFAHTVRMKHTKGLADIARLLVNPGSEIAAVDLYGDRAAPAVPEGHLGDVLDAQARAAYRRRLAELEEELADAEAMNDRGRAEKAHAERDFLATELSAAVGLGGRPRITGDPRERARKAVTNRVRLAINRVAAVHPALDRHLRHSIRTGVFCSYEPEHPTAWRL
jgi:hypothetical protein